MIVRLKAGNEVVRVTSTKAFQFYDSPIKSVTAVPSPLRFHLFQFYDSPIKSVDAMHLRVFGNEFQFYDSPIKRVLSTRGFLALEVSIL